MGRRSCAPVFIWIWDFWPCSGRPGQDRLQDVLPESAPSTFLCANARLGCLPRPRWRAKNVQGGCRALATLRGSLRHWQSFHLVIFDTEDCSLSNSLFSTYRYSTQPFSYTLIVYCPWIIRTGTSVISSHLPLHYNYHLLIEC